MTENTINIERFIPTGDEGLNHLLAVDAGESKEAGILINKIDENGKLKIETPIVIIEGETATGKTTLALQIAHAAYANIVEIKNKHNKRNLEGACIYYYNVEQSVDSLFNLIKNFDLQKATNTNNTTDTEMLGNNPEKHAQINEDVEFDENIYFNLGKIESYKEEKHFKHSDRKFYFNQFSPRPISEEDDKKVFEQRLSELRNVLNNIRNNDRTVLFIIDSLTAFAGRTLNRDDLNRLFLEFKTRKIPVILTLERHETLTVPESAHFYENARFIADVVIRLTRGEQLEHLQFYLEVLKSRYCRQGLGKHLFKIRTKYNAQYIGSEDRRTGIVVYPSIHFVLSIVRAMKSTNPKPTYFIEGKRNKLGLNLILNEHNIWTNSSIAIVGPFGTHKLALGMNLAMGHIGATTKHRKQRILIINFGGRSDFKFEGIAWTQYNQRYAQLENIDTTNSKDHKIKFWHSSFKLDEDNEGPQVVMTTFKVGQLTPEECFYVIEKKLAEYYNKKDKKIQPFSSVLLSNIAEMTTGFPLLANDSLFLPCLVDLFEAYNLVTVAIGVEDESGVNNSRANFSLFARADYRIRLSHYPNIYGLSERIIEKAQQECKNPRTRSKQSETSDILKQYVSLVIDNVSGKHYVRTPIWLSVDQKEAEKIKTLKLSKFPSVC